MKRRGRETGFTIVELLIVIVIIGVLAAITIVAYNGIQERARMASARSFAAQVARSPDILNAVAYYDFEQGSGTSVPDRTERANDGAVFTGGTATYSTDTPSGTGRSFQFNGATRITTTIPLRASYYLKSAWVKPTGCSNIISASSGSSDAFYLPSCRVNAGHNGSWGQLTDSVALNDGKWHHLVLEFTQTTGTDGTLKLWRDGALVKTETVPTPTNIDLTTPQIGAYGTGNFYTGLMDDIIIITR